MHKISCLWIAIILISALPLFAVGGLQWSTNATWESRYIAEGREELDEGGIIAAEVVAAYEGFEFGAWSALGDSVHYQELALTLAYGNELMEISWTAGYTFLEFEPGSEDDDELFISLERTLPLDLVVGAALVYSFEAEGSFLELGVARAFDVVENRVVLSPYAVYGFDFGYRTESHDGSNHVQLGVECECALTDQVSIFAYAAHSFAQKDIKREGLGDVSWIGFGVNAAF